MGKTVVVMIIVLLSLACGALAWEVMRQQVEKDDLHKQVKLLETRLASLELPRPEQPSGKWASEDMFEDLQAHIQSLDRRTQDLAASQKELTDMLAELKKSGVAAKPSGEGLPADVAGMSDEQKEALREMVQKEAKAQDLARANMIKKMVKQRFTSELEKASKELDLTPMQKDDVSKLIDKQIDKGFQALMKAFEEGNLEAARDQIRKLMQESEEEMKKILDPDQIEKLEKMMPRGRQGGPLGPDGFRPPAPPDPGGG